MMVNFISHVRADFVTNQTKLKHCKTLVLCEKVNDVDGHILCHVSELLTPVTQIFACDLHFWDFR